MVRGTSNDHRSDAADRQAPQFALFRDGAICLLHSSHLQSRVKLPEGLLPAEWTRLRPLHNHVSQTTHPASCRCQTGCGMALSAQCWFCTTCVCSGTSSTVLLPVEDSCCSPKSATHHAQLSPETAKCAESAPVTRPDRAQFSNPQIEGVADTRIV